MNWWTWVIIGIVIAFLVIDWIIVMGTNPRKWKGGKK